MILLSAVYHQDRSTVPLEPGRARYHRRRESLGEEHKLSPPYEEQQVAGVEADDQDNDAA